MLFTKTLDKRLAAQYGASGFTVPWWAGQVFYADYAKPKALWRSMESHVTNMFPLAMVLGKDVFYFGDWIRQPGVAICSTATMVCVWYDGSWNLPAKLSYDPAKALAKRRHTMVRMIKCHHVSHHRWKKNVSQHSGAFEKQHRSASKWTTSTKTWPSVAGVSSWKSLIPLCEKESLVGPAHFWPRGHTFLIEKYTQNLLGASS